MVINVSNYTDYNFTRMYLLVILEKDYPLEWVGPVTLYLSFKTKSRYVPQITFYSCLLKFCTVYKRTYIPVKLDRLFYIYRDVNINKKNTMVLEGILSPIPYLLTVFLEEEYLSLS